MCIIVSKEKGIELPKESILENCFNRNKDGAGFMYCYENRVHIIKGLMTFKDFMKEINKLKDKVGDLKDINLVMHFRIGTKGKNDKATTHPFPITNKVGKLTSTNISCDIGMVHNGVIYEYSKDKDLLSDTQHFIKEFVYGLKVLNHNFLEYKQIRDMLLKSCENTKLVFLTDRDKLYYIGEFIEEDGVKYSNGTYKTYNYSSYYGVYDYDDYYDYDGWYSKYYTKQKTIDTTQTKTSKTSDFIVDKLKEKYISKKDSVILNSSKHLVWSYTTDKEYSLKDKVYIVDKDFKFYEVKHTWEYGYTAYLLDTDIEVYDIYGSVLGKYDLFKEER